MTKRKRTDAQATAEANYEAVKKAAGEWVQVNVRLKAKSDVAMMQALRERFPDMTDAAIAKMALKLLAGKKN